MSLVIPSSGDDQDIRNSQEIQKQSKISFPRAKARVFFVRHGESQKAAEDSTGGSSTQPPQTSLSRDGIDQSRKAGKYIHQALGTLDNLSELRYAEDTTRVIETTIEMLDVIIGNDDDFSNPNWKKLKIDDRLRSTDKNLLLQEYKNADDYCVSAELSRVLGDVRTQVRDTIYSNETGVGIVIIGHKSDSSGTEVATREHPEKYKPFDLSIANGEIRELDIDEDGNWIIPDKHPEMLFLNQKNLESILEAIRKNIPELLTEIELFEKHELSIWELQNRINEILQKHPKYFEILLKSENSDISSFCLANLIIKKNFSALYENYDKNSSISQKELDFLLRYHGSSQEKGEIFKLINLVFIQCPNHDETLEQIDSTPKIFEKFFPELENLEIKEKLIYNRRTYWKAIKIQIRSLDETIKKQKKGSILSRKVVKKNEQNNTIEIDEEEIMRPDNISYVLPAMVGFGKSLWVTELVKKIICRYPEKQVVFIEGSDWKKKTIEDISEYLDAKVKDKDNTILVIDALDETDSDTELQKKIMTLLQNKEWRDVKKIITGRPTTFNEKKNEGFETLGMEFDKNEFIKKKGGTKAGKINGLLYRKEFKDGINNNPLLVYFVCELANNTEGYVRSLDDIINESKKTGEPLKPLLYETVIKLMIIQHKGVEPESKTTEGYIDFFNDIFGDLSILALGLTRGKSYGEIAQEELWSKTKQSKLFNAINILLKIGDNDNYQFAHKSFQEYFVYQYRENCFKNGKQGQEEWYKILQNEKGENLERLFSSVGIMNFQFFEQDANYLINQGGTIPLKEIIGNIGAIGDDDNDSLLKRVVTLSAFQNDPDAIQKFCWAIGSTGVKGGYVLLEKIVNLPAFQNDPDAIQKFCWAIGSIGVTGVKGGHVLLEKVVDLPAFQNDPDAIQKFCWAIGRMWDKGGHVLLEKVVDLPVFKENASAISIFCFAIVAIEDKDGHVLLEKVVDLPAFKENFNAIRNLCWAIRVIEDKGGHVLLEKAVDLPAFKNNPVAIQNFCWAIGDMADQDSYVLLEKIIDLPAFRNDSLAIRVACFVIEKIQYKDSHVLLEKIIDLPTFRNYPETIRYFCGALAKSPKQEAINLFEKIEDLVLSTSLAFYNAACLFSVHGIIEKSLMYLRKDLDYLLQQSQEDLKKQLDWIAEDSDWDGMRDTPEFKSLIREYEGKLK